MNIGLDLWFVLGLGWGVPGVAAATLIAEWTGLALGLWFCRDAFRPGAWRRRGRGWWTGRRCVTMVAVNRRHHDPLGRRCRLCFTTFVFLGARHGDVTLAANQVLLQFLEITAYALDGFAFAAETLVGQAIGRAGGAGGAAGGRLALMWTFWGGVVLGAGLLAGRALADRPDGDRDPRSGPKRGFTCPGSSRPRCSARWPGPMTASSSARC